MEMYNSLYLGIVIQNNDPEHRGRVKVWVPHVSGSVYDKWCALKVDRKFKFPGLNVNSDLNLILNELREDMPWAEYSAPLVGASSSGLYNAYYETGSVSDATYPFSLSGSNYSDTLSAFSLNEEKMGEKPGAVYEKYGAKLTDAFTDTTANNANNVNPNGANYRPSTYSNAAKGIFSIPNVGAHVWVFFRDGVPYYPVYIGYSLGEDDFKSIFQSEDDSFQDYPQTFENFDKAGRNQQDVNTITYRNKMVINQRGAAIEIINTTDRERFKVTSFAGGYIELGNNYNALFNPKNFQLLTQQDKFETIRGHSNYFVGRDNDNIIKGDYLLKVGSLNKNALDAWVTAYTAIADLLALPEGSSTKANLVATVTAQAQALASAEAGLGFGGNHVEIITKHKFSNVGLIFNGFASTRYSLTGKPVVKYRNVTSTGTSTVNESLSAIEYTHIDDMPGGNETHAVGNRYNLIVGSGGIDIKTTGPVNLGGTILAVAGNQVNIASSDDMNLDGGTNLSVIASIVYIRSRNREQVVIDDNLGISKNVIIGGGAYINGETYLQHVTAPVEFQVTESTTISDTGYSIVGATITGTGSGVGGTFKNGDTIGISGGTLTIAQPHTHYFKNLPLTLVANAAAVRTIAETTVNGGSDAVAAIGAFTHYNSTGGNLNNNPNGPVGGVPG